MKLLKYNAVKNNGTTNVVGGRGGDTSSTDTNVSTRSSEREIWGQHDEGDDVDGSMVVNGNITIKAIVPPTYDPDGEDDDGEDEDTETGGGNLNVELTITGHDVVAVNNITAGKHIYVSYPHPDHTGEKKCVAELIKTNADNISSLTTTVSNHTTQIANMQTDVANNATNIQTNTDAIAALQTLVEGGISEDAIKSLIQAMAYPLYGSYGSPIVLVSGQMRRYSTGTGYYFIGHQNYYVSISNSIDQGLMTIKLTGWDGATITVSSVQVTQYRSGDTTDSLDNPSIDGRSDGAHWFEARFNNSTGNVYIREFHEGDKNNDTWVSNNWMADGGIKEINLTIFGYITPPTD